MSTTKGKVPKKRTGSKSNISTSVPEIAENTCSVPARSSSSCTAKEKDTIIAYVHKLSPVKRNKRNTLDYSTLVLQTQDENMKALLYSKHKRQLLLDSANAHTPVKIQRFTKSEDEKILINDMTRISTPDPTEYQFQFHQLRDPGTEIIPIREILDGSNELDAVALRGKAIHVGQTAVVGGKKLKVAQTIFVDVTAKIRLDVWEKQIALIEVGRVYTITNLQVRVWNGEKKVSTTIETTITPVADEDLDKITVAPEAIQSMSEKVIVVECIDVVKSINTSILCRNCSMKILQAMGGNVIHCDRCGSRVRKSSCKRQVVVHIEVKPSGDDAVELTVFQNSLEGIVSNVDKLSEDELAEILLCLENVTIKYDPNRMMVTEIH